MWIGHLGRGHLGHILGTWASPCTGMLEDQILDNRLAHASMRSIPHVLDLWDAAREQIGWPRIIPTDDEERGAKLVVFTLYLVDYSSDLVYSSIVNYLWVFRSWLKLQHQADPVFGVMGWADFMQAVKVVTWVPHEPRRMLPLDLFRALVQSADPHKSTTRMWSQCSSSSRVFSCSHGRQMGFPSIAQGQSRLTQIRTGWCETSAS